jgi:hypothetical protein
MDPPLTEPPEALPVPIEKVLSEPRRDMLGLPPLL